MKRSLLAAFLSLGLIGSGVGRPLVGCGTNSGGSDGGMTPTGGSDVTAADVKGTQYATFAVNKLILPMTNKDFAIDLNGDTKIDNQLGNIIGTLATQGLDAQSGVDASVQDGSVVVLMSVQTSDTTLKTSEDVKVTFYLGKSFNSMTAGDGGCTGCPDFSGSGMFTVDTAQSPVDFFGKLANGKFDSNNPVTTKTPATITLKVALISGTPPLSLVVNGAHIAFTAGTDAASGKPGLLDGRIQGSIKNSDVQNTIIPAVATLLTKRIMADPNSSSSKQIASIFDTGMCSNPDGTMAKAGDNKIDTCEVAGNSIIMAVLAPDVQIYDDAGNYAPNKANTKKDSLSLALSFTAVQSSFMRP